MNAARSTAVAVLVLLCTSLAAAQVPTRPDVRPPPLPPDLNTAPAPASSAPGTGAASPAPGQFSTDSEPEPQVTRTERGENVIEEYRIKGELRYIRVTPRHGRSYYLFPQRDGTPYIRRDSLDPTLSVPMWALFSW
jgi:hypothetical protein